MNYKGPILHQRRCCELFRAISLCVIVGLAVSETARGDDKESTVRGEASKTVARTIFARPEASQLTGSKLLVGEGDTKLPMVVVQGTPYEMGRQLGQVLQREMHEFLPAAIKGIANELKVSEADLVEVWSRSAAFADDRIEQELAGLADGSGLPLTLLQAIHAVPYSCPTHAAALLCGVRRRSMATSTRLETSTGVWKSELTTTRSL